MANKNQKLRPERKKVKVNIAAVVFWSMLVITVIIMIFGAIKIALESVKDIGRTISGETTEAETVYDPDPIDTTIEFPVFTGEDPGVAVGAADYIVGHLNMKEEDIDPRIPFYQPGVFPEPMTIEEQFGNSRICWWPNKYKAEYLVNLEHPGMYYPDLKFAFAAFMDYRTITLKGSDAYRVTNAEGTYIDEYGFRRSKIADGEFKYEGDDYIVALGTFYKEEKKCGQRYLIQTTTGAYTCIAGETKADKDTDPHNMFGYHGNLGGIVEFVVDTTKLEKAVRISGNCMSATPEALQGEIVNIYRIS